MIHISIENKYCTPKTAFYTALITDYLGINRELNNHLLVSHVLGSYTFSCHMYTSLLSNTHKIVMHRTDRPLLACVFLVLFGK